MPAIVAPRPLLVAPADLPKPRRACPTSTRRRTKPYSSRRRPAVRGPLPDHPFDALPWLAALDATPSSALADIADLSQIPDPRRPVPDLVQTPPPCPSTPPSRPTTPPSRFVPSRVRFHNLMPVLCDDEFAFAPR
ncbi:hypothetical protein H2248_009934 [Termitomyces sp. 'cryptogamus']|nr:hypothetical protein H2248_009934 [Termitomyces sp. 'cryptogamus']